MKRAALGVRMHSGWGVVVAVSLDGASVELLDRRRIVTIDPKIAGSKQPYHYVARHGVPDAKKFLASSASVSERLARAAIEELVQELEERDYRVMACAVLLASGRPLPPLEKILAAHPLLHTAEGEFFRNSIRRASEGLKIPVTAIRERDLPERTKTAFAKNAGRVQRRIETLGKSIGPPWTKDHKSAALAASIVLAR
jgi:hypothetical protein